MGATNLSICRPDRGEPVDGTLVDGRGAHLYAESLNAEDAIFRANRITEKTLLKGLLYEGVTRYGFPAFRPRPLAGQLGLERRQGPSQYTRLGPAHRPARI